jgi:hypothetical protein
MEENLAVETPVVEQGREETPQVDEVKSPEAIDGRGEVTEGASPVEDDNSLKPLYTKATMELSETKKKLEAYEALQNDPEFNQLLQKKFQPQPETPKQLTQEEISNMTPEQVMRYVVDMAKQELKAEYDPIVNKVQMREHQILQQEAKAIVTDFFAKVPQAQQYKEILGSIIKSDNIPINEAWNKLEQALGATKTEAKQEVYQELDKKRDANLLMPGDKSKPTTTTEKMDARTSMMKAMEEAGL